VESPGEVFVELEHVCVMVWDCGSPNVM